MVHYLPYHSFQLATADLPSGLRRQELVAFRRFIARAAERIAQARGGGAIFTGDNLGQVASQTLENLAAVDECITLPIFRPLIAFDKLEIIDLAKKVGLYDLGILPYRDCCSLLARHPATRAKSEQLLAIEERAGIGDLLERTLGEMTTYRYGPGEGGERISVSAPQDMPSSEDG
jgi:thiamine biosynthesis protein ThiI